VTKALRRAKRRTHHHFLAPASQKRKPIRRKDASRYPMVCINFAYKAMLTSTRITLLGKLVACVDSVRVGFGLRKACMKSPKDRIPSKADAPKDQRPAVGW
jgi:hypothetical protein